jgi:hypothetical protein
MNIVATKIRHLHRSPQTQNCNLIEKVLAVLNKIKYFMQILSLNKTAQMVT